MAAYTSYNHLPPAPRPLKPAVVSEHQTTQTVPEPKTGRIKPSPSTIEAEQKPFAFSSMPLRNEKKSGAYIGILGGANFFQDSSTPYRQASNVFSGNKTTNQLDDQEIGDPLAAIKLGYSWNFEDFGWDPLDKSGWDIGMGLEMEFIYTHQVLDGFNLATDLERMSVKFDNFHTMFNFVTHFQNGPWRPYLGIGAGFVYIQAYDYDYDYSLGDFTAPDDETIEFTGQAFLGLDYFINDEWSLFSEYKVIGISSIDVFDEDLTTAKTGPPITVQADLEVSSFMNHYLTLGIKRHF